MESLVRAEKMPARFVGVLSSRQGARGLETAASLGVPTAVVSPADWPDPAAWERALQEQLDAWDCQWVVLAGWMRILSDAFVARWQGRIVNIHPSLLPAFPGLHPQRQALRYGVRISGCTVHLVEPGPVDGGRILAQQAVPVMPDDDEAALSARILEAEHQLYPKALRHLLTKGGPRRK